MTSSPAVIFFDLSLICSIQKFDKETETFYGMHMIAEERQHKGERENFSLSMLSHIYK